ncbi:MAG: glutamine--fructose-6-phosphate transaminase (isomerizing) [Methanomassiliicoccales archaeon]|nr:MAG: glutamine--fructose-6-phosphate transaminase (isomerizing) [Methanomassiliicoccales archaeon]
MCGIVGYTGYRRAQPILLDSLKKLEYRGYDSAGIAVCGEGLELHKTKGEIAELEKTLPEIEGVVGIAHTRWATHGKPSQKNAHPFLDCKKSIALIHNGIIENYLEIKEKLIEEGHEFTSDTDTEVVVHLLEKYSEDGLEKAMLKALHDIEGSYGFVAINSKEKGTIVVARKESPLILGKGNDENFVASDIPALLKETNKIMQLHDGEVATLTPKSIKVVDLDGNEVKREWKTITWNVEDAEKGGFEHFMLKEIYETPETIHNTLLGRVSELQFAPTLHNDFSSVKMVACGTSYHAALTGKYIFEEIANISTTAELASEYRYSSRARERPLTILISQSGETADTLGASREAKLRGCPVWAITNYMGSSLAREVGERNVLYTRAGIEIGVAATKTFTAQLIALYLAALQLASQRHAKTSDQIRRMAEELRTLPRVAWGVLGKASEIRSLAKKYHKVEDAYFIGRGRNYPVSLEGALKLKEISYIHGEGYAAGELKHGPLALLSEETLVVAIAVQDHTYPKMLGNIREVNARSSPILGIGYEDDEELHRYVDDVLYVPRVSNILSPVPISIALQLFAYYVAKERGCEIDKPRHLAKTVTVE